MKTAGKLLISYLKTLSWNNKLLTSEIKFYRYIITA